MKQPEASFGLASQGRTKTASTVHRTVGRELGVGSLCTFSQNRGHRAIGAVSQAGQWRSHKKRSRGCLLPQSPQSLQAKCHSAAVRGCPNKVWQRRLEAIVKWRQCDLRRWPQCSRAGGRARTMASCLIGRWLRLPPAPTSKSPVNTFSLSSHELETHRHLSDTSCIFGDSSPSHISSAETTETSTGCCSPRQPASVQLTSRSK